MLKKFALPELNNIRHLLLPSAIIYLALVFLMPRTGHLWDTACWGIWSTRMHSGGLAAAYTEGSPVNYLPLYLYVLRFYGWIFEADQIFKHLYLLKAFTLLFDISSILLLCSLVRPASKRYRYILFGLFNIGFFYNTLVWNQVDGILTFFVFASFYFAFHQRILLSVFLFLLALNFKLQAIIFLPIIGLMWLPQLKPKLLFQIVAVLLISETIIILPFLIAGNASGILAIATGSVDYFQFISLNAYNLWHLICDGDLMTRSDAVPFIGPLTYKQTGMILFLVFSALVCVPLYLKTIREMIQKKTVQFDLKTMLLGSGLIVCFFFYFNTQMHERYIHPLIIFSTALAFLYKQWTQWMIFSIAYALSLESICKYLELKNYHTLIFHPEFIAVLYGIAMIQLLYVWFKIAPFKKEI